MSTGDNPFADDDDDLDKTVVRPAQPSPTPRAESTEAPARATEPAAAPQPTAPPSTAAPPRGAASPEGLVHPSPNEFARDPRLLAGSSPSRLLDAAAPMLALIVATRDLQSHPEPEGLLDGAIAEIRGFETEALAAGYTTEQIRLARYALCATMDDVVLATPWGGQTAWNHRGLVSTIHRETMSGERFYALLDTLTAKPEEHREELLLFYACLSLGFEGKYRIMPRGASELSRVRSRLYRLIAQDAEPASGPLSPAGAGRGAAWRPPGGVVPYWVPVMVAVLLLVGMYVLWTREIDRVQAAVLGVEWQFSSELERAAVAPPPPQPARPEPAEPAEPAFEPEPEPVVSPYERVSAALSTEIAQGNVEVLELPTGIALRIVAPDQFDSGAATASDSLSALAGRIGSVLDTEEGDIAVIGHTDSIPMRANASFADNDELSLARAEAAAELVRPRLLNPGRVRAEGLGPQAPIADNATPEGRARNRRIEVILLEPGASFAGAIETIIEDAADWRQR